MGGSCMFSKCAVSRGPTECEMGTCFCQEGYCRYPASTLHIQARYCVARIPDKTCHLTHFCWSGGLETSFCESGLCMCKWGYHPVKNDEGKYECVSGASEMAVALAANATAEEIRNLIESQEHSNQMVTLNMFIAALWASAVVFFLTVGVALAVRRLRTSKVQSIAFNEMMLG